MGRVIPSVNIVSEWMTEGAIYLDVGLFFDQGDNLGLIPKVNPSRVNQELIPYH